MNVRACIVHMCVWKKQHPMTRWDMAGGEAAEAGKAIGSDVGSWFSGSCWGGTAIIQWIGDSTIFNQETLV